ncbi:sialic acid-binding Ig-like lectin 11 [Chiloscyllium plagiosum]|uniref:sialic acid-binding Ig-like lectin 11 n=1 Tax=Chiloscyllium plagiosum TaxID=36176 RepID=UPI001CB843F5|nr:sialic acid-binding Ig-like lectin 11 [Chiloscyllium plagiosum]
MTRTSSSNELWLVIPNVTSREAGDYQCVAENEHGTVEGSITITVECSRGESLHVILILGIRAGIFIVAVVLTVAAVCVYFTDKPTIFPVEIIAGKCVSLSCIFNTTCTGTAPVLTWDTPTAVHGSLSNTVTQRGVTLSYTSVLSLTPSLRHQGQTLTCRVSYPTVSSEQTLGLTVQYGPVFSRELECARRAEGITCTCAANSNPPGDLTWHLPHANLSGNQTHGDFVSQQLRVGHLVMGSLTLTGHPEEEETMASCWVRNPHGAATLKAYFWVKGESIAQDWTRESASALSPPPLRYSFPPASLTNL